MNRIVITLFLSLIGLFGKAQYDIGIKTNLGLSIFSIDDDIASTTIKNRPWISGNCGLFLCRHFINKLNCGAELQINYISEKDIFEGAMMDEYGNYTSEKFTQHLQRHITYLNLPLSVGYELNNVTLNFGLQSSLVLMSGAKSKVNDPISGERKYKFKSLNIDKFSFGPKFFVDFKATDKISFELAYFYGLNDLLKEDVGLGWSWKIHQATLGVRYNLRTKETLK